MLNKIKSMTGTACWGLLLAPMIALATGVTTDAASLAAVPQAQAPTRLDTNDAAYYIDGKPATKTAADQLDGERDIASVNVLEGEMVHKLLGANAPSTAILITTKKNRGTAAVKAFNQRIDALTADSKNSLLSKEKINMAKAYILVDGKETSEADLARIPVAQIKSTQVFTGAEAAKLYQDKGHNGVVLVTTK